MSDNDNSSPLGAGWRLVLWVAFIVFVILQGMVLLGDDGILARHGFIGGFTAFNEIMLSDPITVAGLIDLTALMICFGVVVANGVPRGQWPWLVLGLVILPIYPGLTALGFLLLFWRRFGQFRP